MKIPLLEKALGMPPKATGGQALGEESLNFLDLFWFLLAQITPPDIQEGQGNQESPGLLTPKEITAAKEIKVPFGAENQKDIKAFQNFEAGPEEVLPESKEQAWEEEVPQPQIVLGDLSGEEALALWERITQGESQEIPGAENQGINIEDLKDNFFLRLLGPKAPVILEREKILEARFYAFLEKIKADHLKNVTFAQEQKFFSSNVENREILSPVGETEPSFEETQTPLTTGVLSDSADVSGFQDLRPDLSSLNTDKKTLSDKNNEEVLFTEPEKEEALNLLEKILSELRFSQDETSDINQKLQIYVNQKVEKPQKLFSNLKKISYLFASSPKEQKNTNLLEKSFKEKDRSDNTLLDNLYTEKEFLVDQHVVKNTIDENKILYKKFQKNIQIFDKLQEKESKRLEETNKNTFNTEKSNKDILSDISIDGEMYKNTIDPNNKTEKSFRKENIDINHKIENNNFTSQDFRSETENLNTNYQGDNNVNRVKSDNNSNLFVDRNIINVKELPDFVSKLVMKIHPKGKHEAKLKLNPPELGDMDLSIQVDKGEVKLLFTVEHTKAADLVQQHLRQLEIAFQGMGLELGGAEINLANGNSNYQEGNFSQFTNNDFQILSQKNEEIVEEYMSNGDSKIIDIRV